MVHRLLGLALTALALTTCASPVTAEPARRAREGARGRKPREITRNIKQPDPVPEEGITEAVKLMQEGRLYRYNVDSARQSVVSLCEKEIGAYTGHKYVVALNSCGSAIFLSLKAAGVKPGDKVLTNAFTFTAVPSAIAHAEAKAVYVESEAGYRIDVDDLEGKVKSSGAKFLLVSHMRGKLADMDKVKAICDKHGVCILEDCAHAIGVLWRGKHSGHHGKVACISSQSYKMLNSGEGGFLLTDDPDVAARATVYAGAYEALHKKHLMAPESKYFGDLPNQLPNYSLRMHAVTAAIVRPQIKTIDARREQYNKRYQKLAGKLNSLEHVTVPAQYDEVTIVGDSIQFTLTSMRDEEIAKVIQHCKEFNLHLELFGHASNARYFKNWKFAPADCELPRTESLIKATLDLRMPLQWPEGDFDNVFHIIQHAISTVLEQRASA